MSAEDRDKNLPLRLAIPAWILLAAGAWFLTFKTLEGLEELVESF